jgi:hypothetical protein
VTANSRDHPAMQDQLSATVQTAQRGLAPAADGVKSQVRDFAGQQRAASADQIGGIAGALEAAANDLQHQDDLANDKASTLAVLADNEQWVANNYDKVVTISERDRSKFVTLTAEEDTVLRCLGAALIMQWNTLPAKLQRELFDDAGDKGELLDTSALRGQIARFLHTHKNDEPAVTTND